MEFTITYSAKTFYGSIIVGEFTATADNIEMARKYAFKATLDKLTSDDDNDMSELYNLSNIDIKISI